MRAVVLREVGGALDLLHLGREFAVAFYFFGNQAAVTFNNG